MYLFSLPASAVCRAWLAPVLTLGALTLTISVQAQATITQYSSRTSFNAAASGLTTFNFNGLAPVGGSKDYSYVFSYYGVVFTAGLSDNLDVVDSAQGAGNPFNGEQYFLTGNYPGALPLVSISLPAGTTAFGADFANFHTATSQTVTALANGKSFTFTAPAGSTNMSVFAGFTSNTPITTLSFSTNAAGAGLDLDNVSFGNFAPAAVPEASTTVSFGLLLALGLGGMVVAKKKNAIASA